MTTEERLEKLERELTRAKRCNCWLVAGLVLCLGASVVVWALSREWGLAIFSARNPPKWTESGVFRATRPPRSKLHEIETPHFRAFLALGNG